MRDCESNSKPLSRLPSSAGGRDKVEMDRVRGWLSFMAQCHSAVEPNADGGSGGDTGNKHRLSP